MGYSTQFEGCIHVKCRTIKFGLVEILRNAIPKSKQLQRAMLSRLSNLEKLHHQIFQHILLFAIKDEQPKYLVLIALISRNTYYLSSKINQSLFFNKVDKSTANLVNHLQMTRRMMRSRYINGKDYGIDGQYFGDETRYDGSGKYQWKTYYQGKPFRCNVPPRTQFIFFLRWTFDETNQTIVWDQGEKFYYYIEWLIYLINNIFHPRGYVLSGEIKWQGEYDNDFGVISIDDDGQNNVYVKNLCENGYRYSNEKLDLTQMIKFSKDKIRNIYLYKYREQFPPSEFLRYKDVKDFVDENIFNASYDHIDAELSRIASKVLECTNDKKFWKSKQHQSIDTMQKLVNACMHYNVA